jgi:hypothetical protein
MRWTLPNNRALCKEEETKGRLRYRLNGGKELGDGPGHCRSRHRADPEGQTARAAAAATRRDSWPSGVRCQDSCLQPTAGGASAYDRHDSLLSWFWIESPAERAGSITSASGRSRVWGTRAAVRLGRVRCYGGASKGQGYMRLLMS